MVWIWAEGPECKERGTGRERWSVRVRALLSKRPLDFKEVAVKYISLSFLSVLSVKTLDIFYFAEYYCIWKVLLTLNYQIHFIQSKVTSVLLEYDTGYFCIFVK